MKSKTPRQTPPIERLSNQTSCHCNRCRVLTRHSLVDKNIRQEPDDVYENGDYSWINTFVNAVWKCAGCQSFTIEERFGNHVEFSEGTWDSNFFPKRNHGELQAKRFLRLPANLQLIYREGLIAFNNNALILTAIALRGLIEGICKEHTISGKDLAHKINGMTQILPKNIVVNLHNLRFMGNDAAHELKPPSIGDLKLGIEICEDILNFLYELDYKAAILERSRNLNKSKNKKTAHSM